MKRIKCFRAFRVRGGFPRPSPAAVKTKGRNGSPILHMIMSLFSKPSGIGRGTGLPSSGAGRASPTAGDDVADNHVPGGTAGTTLRDWRDRCCWDRDPNERLRARPALMPAKLSASPDSQNRAGGVARCALMADLAHAARYRCATAYARHQTSGHPQGARRRGRAGVHIAHNALWHVGNGWSPRVEAGR